MKRFTETTKWLDPWFAELSTKSKLLWMYLCDNCDNAGVVDLSTRIAGVLVGCAELEIDDSLDDIETRITILDNGKILICGFIHFQFGTLSEASNLHKNVIKLIKQHELKISDFKGSLTLKEAFMKAPSKGKGKGKGISKGKGKGIPNKKVSGFQPPTIEQITQQAIEKEYTDFDADHFWNFYESKGWVVGRVGMKSWKAAMANWNNNSDRFGTKSKGMTADEKAAWLADE